MDVTPASPASSDSDAYNTEDARLYFGPLKTPERNFVAASQGRLFPTTPNPLLRRSPRLSSPRPRSTEATDVRTIEEDIMDIEQVAQLVKASDEEEGDAIDSGLATPQGVHLLPDEPSSALADKIIHALDNPSPPPRPPLLLSMFDPYHTTVADPSNDYQTDLMSLKISQGPEYDESSFPASSATNALAVSISPSPAIPPHVNNPVEPQEDLICFDSFSTPPPENTSHLDSTFHRPLLSVDDLLSQSPATLSSPPVQKDVRDVVMAPLESVPPTSHLLSNQSPDPSLSSDTVASTVVVPEIIVFGLPDDDSEQQCLDSPTLAENQPVPADTPLRRSARPRRSVTPNLPLPTAPSVPTAPPSPARTQVKKKVLNSDLAENVASGSRASMLEGRQRSPSHPTSSTTIRVRHRSPGKGPLSFQRELGSLSPTSSNLLSGLGFTASESDNGDLLANQEEVAVRAQPMFSFSAFSPPTDATGPSTPDRSSGPIRFSSPVKGTSSSNKFRIQTPAPNDPKNTPARRIPIEEAIAQGHISPQKSIQIGFRPNGTPLTSTPTPARRVLVSNLPSHPPLKSNTLRFGKPAKTSGEPRQQPESLDKGKGKEIQNASESSAAQTKLPFPLVASIPAPIEVPASSTGDVVTKAKPSPLKSRLKQVTSRIPRIGVKPYSRSDAPKVGGGIAKGASTARTGGTHVESALSVRRAAPVTGSMGGTAASRVSAIQSGSTTLLKRKREAEKASPVKPRVVLLRQVPQVLITPTDPLPKPPNTLIGSAAAKNKQATSHAPMRIRRVVDPEPSTSTAVQPPSQDTIQETEPLGIPSVASKTAREPSVMKEALPPKQQDELSSGSPMEQDLSLPTAPELIPEHASAPTPLTIVPENNNITLGSSSDLRRTTRSRRTAIVQDVFSNPPSRPSARRKSPAFRSDDIFSGMSLTALKDLTISNTVRNQRYLAAKLETEVVRREGVRPESPAVKVRTMVQKQQEAKDKQRAERANRRARRSGDMGSSDIEGSSDVGYSSPCQDTNMADGTVPLPRHQRGAGEDDDYETPERHQWHKKRTRLFDDVDVMDTDEPIEPKRRVKWDRGLFTTVYIDEVKLGSRETLKENRSLKGILAPTAKALRLDTLGNLPHADTPLADLVQENITVKKIVYDSDVPPGPEDVVVKNTRSKKKK